MLRILQAFFDKAMGARNEPLALPLPLGIAAVAIAPELLRSVLVKMSKGRAADRLGVSAELFEALVPAEGTADVTQKYLADTFQSYLEGKRALQESWRHVAINVVNR